MHHANLNCNGMHVQYRLHLPVRMLLPSSGRRNFDALDSVTRYGKAAVTGYGQRDDGWGGGGGGSGGDCNDRDKDLAASVQVMEAMLRR